MADTLGHNGWQKIGFALLNMYSTPGMNLPSRINGPRLKRIGRCNTTAGRIGSVADSDIQEPFGIYGFHFRLTSAQGLL